MFELKYLWKDVERITAIKDYSEYCKEIDELVKKVKNAIASGSDVDDRDGGRPILMWASYLGNLEIVKALVKAGADVNDRDIYGNVPLCEASDVDVINYLIKEGTDLDEYGYQLLTDAIDDENIEKLEILFDNIEDVNKTGDDGNTVLHYAVKEKAPLEVIEIIVNKGMDWKIKNGDGKTALELAKENEEIKKYLESL